MVTVIVSIGADADPLVTSERTQNLKTSLTALRQQTLPRAQYRIVLVEQGAESQIDATIRSLVDEHVTAYNPHAFNRSWGRNIGAIRAESGVICTFDADIVVPPSFLMRGLLAWQCGARAIRPFAGILYMDRESTLEVHEHLRAGNAIDCESRRYRGGLHLKSKGGCIWTDRSLYIELGGHDERFEGWGTEDNEFWDRLSARATIVQLGGRLLHLYHERPFETTQEAGGNSMLWRMLQHKLVPPPRTSVIGDLDRYRCSNGGRPNPAEQQVIASRVDRRREQHRLRETIVQEAIDVCRASAVPDAQRLRRLRIRALLASRKDDDEMALAYLTGVLRVDPRDVDAWRDLARVLVRKRRAAEALSAALRAVVLAPYNPAPYRELGRVLARAGRLSEATLAYQEALQLDLGDPRTLGELGDALRERRLLDQALAACEIAQLRNKRSLDGFLRLGRVRFARQEWELARVIFQQGLALADAPKPLSSSRLNAVERSFEAQDDLWSHHAQDNCLDDRVPSRPPSASTELEVIDPRHAALYVGLGDALQRLGMIDDAVESFRQALNLSPRDLVASRRLVLALEALGRRDEAVGAWVALAGALESRHRFDEALVADRQATAIKRDCLKALIPSGRVHAIRGDLIAAIDRFERALAIDPEQPLAHTERGRALSALGRTDAGWREFAWWCHPHSLQVRAFTQPVWDGVAKLDGQTLLVWADQELGDTIQWLRYVPVLEQLGARVIVECQPRLVPLVRTMHGIHHVVSRQAPLLAFDVHVPITLLPIVSELCRSTPSPAPYFTADATLVEVWLRRLEDTAGPEAFTVGICWAGHPDGINGAFRFAPLKAFAPLAGCRQVRFVSLQMGPQTSELLGAPAGLHVLHLQDESCSTSDTAALMASLNLIITVDTMVAHLAGALGHPVWLLLPRVADWRWLRDREDTPLYPTMKLWRQETAGDWAALFEHVRGALERTVAESTRLVGASRKRTTEGFQTAIIHGSPTLG